MDKPAHTVKLNVTVDRCEFDEFAADVERTSATLRQMGHARRVVMLAVIASATFIAAYFIEQRTEQVCVAAGNTPDACRTTLGDLF